MALAVPFRVNDKPYVVWSNEPARENIEFLRSIDCGFYQRTVQNTFCDSEGFLRFASDDYEARKDYSSFARLIWNHGLETLTTLIGAYIQAPHVVYGFFLKCQNADCRKIANYLLTGQIPRDNCLDRLEFDFTGFVRGTHLRAPWAADENTNSHLSRALQDLLRAYDRDDHRAEYNSIKHGLRAHHGRSAIAIGTQEALGIPCPPENMTMLSDSVDGSHFLSVAEIPKLSKKQSREQFFVRQSSVGWSLDRTLKDIQLFSTLIGNIVSTLKIAAGIPPNEVQFVRPDVPNEWWSDYFNDQGPMVQNLSFQIEASLPANLESAEKQATSFYRRHKRSNPQPR